jgi:DNA-binding transcriptional ArsR family regulator
VKEVLHTGRRVVDDLDALRALAHPERSAILKLLMSGRSRTATECADAVGASPSACSYHLRQLERFGFVERDDETDPGRPVDGRTRRWKAAAIGFTLGARRASEASPEELAVFGALRRADRTENERLERNFLEHFEQLPAAWQDAAEFSNYELEVSPTEIADLIASIDSLLLPFRVGARAERPADARPVHLQLTTFLRVGDTAERR